MAKYLYFKNEILKDIGYEFGGHPKVRKNISHFEYIWRKMFKFETWKEINYIKDRL